MADESQPKPLDNSLLLAPITLSLNPFGTLFLGYETPQGSFWLALSTATFTPPETLPLELSTLEAQVIIVPSDPEKKPRDGVKAETLSIPVSEEEWCEAREMVNRVRPGTFASDMSYHAYLRGLVKVYLDHFEDFERQSFPMAFRKGFEPFMEVRKKQPGVLFGEYVSGKFRESNENPMVLDWVAWAGGVLHAVKVVGAEWDGRCVEFGLVAETVADDDAEKKKHGVGSREVQVEKGKRKVNIPVDVLLLFFVASLVVAWVFGFFGTRV
ncbi:hypothetical protein HDU98_007793 [Podochytrium sp. JEL0797]|nr:hypothetical protein HDU98_007793 [Podochytrium sp. JEL0797]